MFICIDCGLCWRSTIAQRAEIVLREARQQSTQGHSLMVRGFEPHYTFVLPDIVIDRLTWFARKNKYINNKAVAEWKKVVILF